MAIFLCFARLPTCIQAPLYQGWGAFVVSFECIPHWKVKLRYPTKQLLRLYRYVDKCTDICKHPWIRKGKKATILGTRGGNWALGLVLICSTKNIGILLQIYLPLGKITQSILHPYVYLMHVLLFLISAIYRYILYCSNSSLSNDCPLGNVVPRYGCQKWFWPTTYNRYTFLSRCRHQPEPLQKLFQGWECTKAAPGSFQLPLGPKYAKGPHTKASHSGPSCIFGS